MPGTSTSQTPEVHTGGWRTTVNIPEDALRWGPTFREGAQKTLANTQMRRNLGHATRTIRNKRQMRVDEMPDWEDLRNAAEAVKFEVASRLPELLEQFEANVTAHGGIVHWARDAAEANKIITQILRSKGCDDVVKVKSMATQETNLNEHLKSEGITAHETDLAEMIVQLADDMPSHIVVPAIHRNRSEVRGIFLDRMDDAPEDLSDTPEELAGAARAHLRKKFLHAPVAISGTNMGIAETGTVSIFESEGNGRMCLTLPDTLITLMGIEKLVPRYQDAEIFTQLLPRSATGERMNPYTSMWTGVTPGDGPQEFHLILMDNGRTKVLSDAIGRQALACIRCGSCMNICPVYQHTSGHAYGSVYPGPIGAILTPQLTQGLADDDPVHTLPFASSLCGACGEVCPVKIDIPTILIHLRARSVELKRRTVPDIWDLAMGVTSPAMSNSKLWNLVDQGAKATRLLGGKKGRIGHMPLPVIEGWTGSRDVPVTPKESFREWWKRTHPGSDAYAPRTDAPVMGIPLAGPKGMTTRTNDDEEA
ncbi:MULTISPECIES: LutB/LldF family L-lactate oxidation iron-sulfur protein [Actinomyces]|uniref:Iron-sulfur cluster-binding protein n=1 Tax=Actinomyces respiraculi TaxID=2744574 RepID=A0A7T0LN38_9ACTO|nr:MULTISPECIES: LutB/LldF family L-lactate oxidation iron-sulfur protein [Actinomyces]QPL06687.1 iron-sulfur cluster-binding protein [Actinomyces respiraculi]